MKVAAQILLTFVLLITPAFSKNLLAQAEAELQEVAEGEITFFQERNLEGNFFQNDTHFGGILTTGNSQEITLQGSSDTVYRVKRFRNEWNLGGYYDRTAFNSDSPDEGPQTNAKYVFGAYRMDYFLSSDTTYFLEGGGFTDEIKGIPLGGFGGTGVSHYFIWTKKTALNLSGGYTFVGEDLNDPNPSRHLHNAKVELSFRQVINPHVTLFLNVDSLKDVTDLEEWLVNGNIHVQVKLYKILSLFFGFTARLDNQPVPGFRKLDTMTNFSLGISFKSPEQENK
ncbi:MAG TPA: DUF481 domain-containing protein [bacterium]|nr:DUF481 domain-containing protein [bacterium]